MFLLYTYKYFIIYIEILRPNLNYNSIFHVLSAVRKLGPTKIKRAVNNRFSLRRSQKTVRRRLTEKTIRHAMEQLDKGKSAVEVAAEVGVTARHIRRLRTEFHTTGSPHIPQRLGRPAQQSSPDDVRMVLDQYKQEPAGVLRTAMALQKKYDISYMRVYKIMKDNGLVTPSTAKSRKRK